MVEANAVIRQAMITAGYVDDAHAVTIQAGERLGAGDRIATRRNDRDLGVANRETWTVTATTSDGALRVTGRSGQRLLPAAYVATDVELAYACTVHGAQGSTLDTAHLLLDEHTTAAAGYVGLTRGRHANTAHLIATDDGQLASEEPDRNAFCGRLSYWRDAVRGGSRRRSSGPPGTEEKWDDALLVDRARPRRDGRVRQLRLQGGDGGGVRRDRRLQ